MKVKPLAMVVCNANKHATSSRLQSMLERTSIQHGDQAHSVGASHRCARCRGVHLAQTNPREQQGSLQLLLSRAVLPSS